MNAIPKLFVAVDKSNTKEAKELIQKLTPKSCGIKVGKELFTACGPKIIDWIQSKGFEVFLDLKYHDIPNTVEKACSVASKMGVSILNVHALGGKEMMLSAREGIDKSKNRPCLIAVTLLTSTNKKTLESIGFYAPIDNIILNLATSAKEAKLDGIVCSAEDISKIKASLPESFLYVTTGIRFSNSLNDDQKRIVSPSEAINMGSNILVIGRPITQAKDPEGVLNQIINEIT